MVPVTSLLVPIAVSEVLVFIASSLIHMMLPYHRSDDGRVPSEDEAMEAPIQHGAGSLLGLGAPGASP